MRCTAVQVARVAVGFMLAAVGRYDFEEVLETRAIDLRCELPDGHEGNHETTLPAEAGVDAGKRWLFENRGAS